MTIVNQKYILSINLFVFKGKVIVQVSLLFLKHLSSEMCSGFPVATLLSTRAHAH